MIQTERLTLTPLAYKELLKYAFGRKGSIKTDEDEAMYIDVAQQVKVSDEPEFRTIWVVTENGEWIGDVGLKGTPNEFGIVEIWYFVASEKRGLGYAPELAKGMIEWLQKDERVNFICAAVDFGNVSSERALEKNGFKKINRTENQHIFIKQLKF